MIKVRPITHIITGAAPVNPWPPTGSYLLCARLYTNTFLDHITVNSVSWNYGWGSSQTYADANCTQVLSNLSNWSYYTINTVLQTTGQNEYGTYVDIFTDSSNESETAVDFSVILGNRQVHELTDDSWKITRVEVYKVGMTNGVYRVNNNPTIGQIFMDRNSWTEFPLTPSSSTKFRPITHIITSTATAYKRYMWKWEGLEGWEGTMQISKLRINNESLPYTHVLEYLYKGYDFGSQTSEMMINSTTGDNAKWCCGGQSTDGWGYFIFDLDNRVVPNYYSLTTAGDNSGYSNRRPLNFYLYGTLDDNNTSADQGWILLHHGTKSMIPEGNNEEFTMNISNVQSSSTIRPLSVFEVQPEPVFPSVQIGNQIWMSENLSIDDGGEGIMTFNSVISYDYELGPQTYYTWDAAMRVANSIPGWHLPSAAEWDELMSYTDYQSVKSTYGWSSNNGTNTTGMNILPAGRVDPYGSYVSQMGIEANIWSSNSISYSQSYCTFIYNTNWSNMIGRDKNYTNSVRLVKD